MTRRLLGSITTTLALAALALWPAGCASPLERSTERELRDELINSHRAFIKALAASPVVEIKRQPSAVEADLRKQPDRMEQLNKMGGPAAYEGKKLELEKDLMGRDDTPSVSMTLRHAIELTVRHNLEINGGRLAPAVTETQVTQAEAVFDAVFYATMDWQKLDTPRPPSQLSVFGPQQSETLNYTTGIRKLLSSGGEIKAEAASGRNWADPSNFGTSTVPSFTYYDASVLLGITQPLLRNFGSDVSRAQIELSKNARRQSVYDLHKTIQDTILNTERAYWALVFTQRRLLIQQRLLERTIADREVIRQRLPFDASPVRMTEANSFVEIRRSEVIRDRQEVRRATDALKRLINDPELPLAGETMILPLDNPAEAPLTYSLIDAVTTALRHRPELRRALSEIEDASIRQRVADNQRLPQLDLGATMRYNGVADKTGAAIGNVSDADYIDYIVGAKFEVPIGNRAAEALFRQRQIERQYTVIRYRQLAQDAVLDVKDSLRQVISAWEIIDSARAARLAATDNLRALEEQERVGNVALTPEFLLDLKLSTQQRLADTETAEVSALTEYNSAIARFYQVMGTLLERNGIRFEDPENDADKR
ncbi:MAG: TolC family protein [Planctomycetes bacterium]|nr:TolC family protein [Planctomycetota bacterium]